MNHYLIWATGTDRPGFVSAITKTLYGLGCNLEDSSMMRLGSEFAMFVIITSARNLTEENFSSLYEYKDTNVGLKRISAKQARFTPVKKESYIVRVHGEDKPGIVHHLTSCLANHHFNITDLSTHRTTFGEKPGYIVLLEGELLKKGNEKKLKTDLRKLASRLNTNISLEPVSTKSF